MGYNVTHNPGDSPGIVYLMRRGPYFKVGRTINLRRRLQSVRIAVTPTEARAYPIELVSTIACKDMFVTERRIHRRFEQYRADCGEWFLLPDDEVTWFRGQPTDGLI